MRKYTLLHGQPSSVVIDWIHHMVKTGAKSIEVTFEKSGRKTIFVRRDYIKGVGFDVAKSLGVLNEYKRLNGL
jgi:hypothetical protein